MTLEQYHGQSECAVETEIFAHFTLIVLVRLFADHADGQIDPGTDTGKAAMPGNFKHSPMTVARNIENLLRRNAAALGHTIDRSGSPRIQTAMDKCLQR